MKVICAWCGKTIKSDDGTSGLDSHGICKDCENLAMCMFAKEEEEQHETERS